MGRIETTILGRALRSKPKQVEKSDAGRLGAGAPRVDLSKTGLASRERMWTRSRPSALRHGSRNGAKNASFEIRKGEVHAPNANAWKHWLGAAKAG